MEQLEKFKTIIYQIIGDNKFILSALELIRDRGDLLPSIEMSDMSSSAFIPDTNTIQVSIPDIIECYDLSKGCKINLTFRFFFNFKYLNYNVRSEKCFGISINMPLTIDESNHVEEMLYGSDFLQHEKTTQNDVVKWINMNKVNITWERENSKSCKDKFIDAYIHFRKNSQL